MLRNYEIRQEMMKYGLGETVLNFQVLHFM